MEPILVRQTRLLEKGRVDCHTSQLLFHFTTVLRVNPHTITWPINMTETLNASRPIGIDSGRARLSLVLLLAVNLFNYIDRQVLAAVEPVLRKELNLTEVEAGWLPTAFLLSYMCLAPVLGWLADRISRWTLVGLCVMVWSLASGASGMATTFGALLLTRVFVGVGEAGYGPAAPAMIGDLFPIARRGSALAWFYVAIPVGSALGYVLGGMVASAPGWGWRWAFYLVVPPGLLLGTLCLLMRDSRQNMPESEAPSKKSSWEDYKALLRTPSYVLDTLGLAAMTFAIGGIAFWMPEYIHVYRGEPDLARVNTLIGGITVVSGLAATLLGGWAGDKLRGRFPGSYFLVSGGGMLIGFPLFLSMLWSPFPAAWIFFALAVFFLFFNTGPSNTILVNITRPSIRATAFAMNIFIIHALGDAISPPLIGWIAHCYNMQIAFVVISGVMVAGGLFWLWGAKYLEADTRRAAQT